VVAVAVSTVVVVSMGEVSVAVVSTGEASAVARSTAVVVSVEDVSPVAVSTAVAFVGDVSAVAVSTAVAFVATVLVITDSLMMSSSAAFRGGGAGAIRTDITVTTITRTITMDTADTVTMVGPVTDTAMAADRAFPEFAESVTCRLRLFEISPAC
jgi:hypothetical protein